MAQSQALSREWTPRQFKKRDSGNPKRSKHEKKKDGAGVRNSRKAIRAYSLGEEIANSITHGVGALLAIAAIPLCVVAAVRSGGGLHLLAALVYSIFMLLEYVMSTLYHAIAAEKAKRVFKVLDHSFIYLFIAASYSPYCLVTLVDCHGSGCSVPAGSRRCCTCAWAGRLYGLSRSCGRCFPHRASGFCLRVDSAIPLDASSTF